MLSNAINFVWAQTTKIASYISKYFGTFTHVLHLCGGLNETKVGQFQQNFDFYLPFLPSIGK